MRHSCQEAHAVLSLIEKQDVQKGKNVKYRQLASDSPFPAGEGAASEEDISNVKGQKKELARRMHSESSFFPAEGK